VVSHAIQGKLDGCDLTLDRTRAEELRSWTAEGGPHVILPRKQPITFVTYVRVTRQITILV